ncbi:MAG: hypothetical protein O7D34_00555 [Ignavibacteria bacterium]|nr:hypothetical protein [Ignavibacteria bacterium]
MPSIEFGFAAATFIIVISVLVVCTLSFLFYRYTLPPVARSKRILLTVLRALSLSLLLILLFEPLLRLVFSSQEPPVLAVLIDNSKSLQIVDKGGDRRQALIGALATPALQDLPNNGELRYYTFGAVLREGSTSEKDSLELTEDATDISAALQALEKEKERYNIHAAVLFTDGSYNSGRNPIYDAEQLGIPIYTVGIGDTTEQKDVLITKVATNDRVYNETSVPVDVTIKSSGFDGERIEATIAAGVKVLDRKSLVLKSGTGEYTIPLTYVPEGEGMKKYVVRISNLKGELTSRNNQKAFFVRILKSKLRILIIASAPSPDLSVIKQTLAEEKHFSVRSYTQRFPSGFYEGRLTVSSVDSADCIVLIAFPTSATDNSTLEIVRAATTQNAKPVLFISGRSLDNGKLQMIASTLPFRTVTASSAEQYVFFQPSDNHVGHPILKIDDRSTADTWNHMPPIFRSLTQHKAKTEATVLGFCRIQGGVTRDPLVLIRNVNRQKALAVLGYGLWRWRLMAQGNLDTEQTLSLFLANSIRWLTTTDEGRPVKVTTSKDLFVEGEPVDFFGQVYDASAKPIDNAQLRVVAQRNESKFETTLRPIGNGRYEGSIHGLTEGDYTFRATAQTDGQQLGMSNGKFSIGELNLEFRDTRMNARLLRQLAFRTGGRFFIPHELDGLTSELRSLLSFAPREVVKTKDLELWNWQYTLGVVVFLFGLEWFIRKRSGML